MQLSGVPDLLIQVFSETGELIGFDVDMAQILARELKVKLEFVPFDYKKMAAQLDAGLFDVIMAGIAVTTPRLTKMTFSTPYMEGTLSLNWGELGSDHGERLAISDVGPK